MSKLRVFQITIYKRFLYSNIQFQHSACGFLTSISLLNVKYV